MIQRIMAADNPHFLFMTHTGEQINDLMMVPNYFFTPSVILRRAPISRQAKRKGWTGCNIHMASIPNGGKIFIVKDGVAADKQQVEAAFARLKAFETADITHSGWLLDVMAIVDTMGAGSFSLQQMYHFERELQVKHPHNMHVKDKIRQQLQVLRNKGYIAFEEKPGQYRKL